jgi:hypothetical protein
MGIRTSTSSDSHQTLNEGWALRQAKKSKPFNKNQKAFLEEKFMIGETSGHKLDATTLSRQMRTAKDSKGQRRFTLEEFLSTKQIKGYFSRRSKCKNKIGENNFKAADYEEALSRIRNTVIEETLAKHPFMFDGYNLCKLVASNKLDKLTLAILKGICQQYELQVTKVIRRKAPFIDAIHDLVNKCSCFNSS